MARTIYLGHDIGTAEARVILKDSDFVDIVYERLGRDAGLYLESMLDAVESPDDAYQRGFRDGMEEASEDNSFHSYNNGHDDGYEEGHESGYAEGYAAGFKAGFQERNPWA